MCRGCAWCRGWGGRLCHAGRGGRIWCGFRRRGGERGRRRYAPGGKLIQLPGKAEQTDALLLEIQGHGDARRRDFTAECLETGGIDVDFRRFHGGQNLRCFLETRIRHAEITLV